MATTQALLTPLTDTKPVVVKVQRELSGEHWCARFLGSKKTSALKPEFRQKADSFIAALRAAGAMVDPESTLRPKERSYLMHCSWLIAKKMVTPEKVPMDKGVLIEWVHPTLDESIKAAEKMTQTYQIDGLPIPPALSTSLHNTGEAIDMTIFWSGVLKIKNSTGDEITIESLPKTGMNPDLHKVGKTYGVIKYFGGDKDKPHWSATGK